MKLYYSFHKRLLEITLFILVIMCCSLGYAMYTEDTNINGTVQGNTNFNVYFNNAWISNTNKGNVVFDNEKIYFNVYLNYPGDKCVIKAEVKNDSSIAVKLKDFIINKEQSDIKFECMDLNSDMQVLKPGEKCEYSILVYWDENSNNMNPHTSNLNIQLLYEQDI